MALVENVGFKSQTNWRSLFKQRDLHTTLRNIGVTPIEQSCVDAHIAADCRKRRPTFLHQLMAAVFAFFCLLTLEPIIKILFPRMAIGLRDMLALAIAVILAIAWSTSLHQLPGYTDLAALVPAGIFLAGFAMHCCFPQVDYIVERWQRDRIQAYVGLPKEVSKSADFVTTRIPGTNAYIIHNDRDPFLEIQMGTWPLQQRAVIEAWATGDSSLDTIYPDFRDWD